MLPNKIKLKYRIWRTMTAKKRIIHHFKNTFIVLSCGTEIKLELWCEKKDYFTTLSCIWFFDVCFFRKNTKRGWIIKFVRESIMSNAIIIINVKMPCSTYSYVSLLLRMPFLCNNLRKLLPIWNNQVKQLWWNHNPNFNRSI